METKQGVGQKFNGVDVARLGETIAAVEKNPVLARFRFYNENKWVNGGHNRSTINRYFGTDRELRREKPFVLYNDEPPVLLGGDLGPNPVEQQLHGLAGCMTTSTVYHAAARGIAIQEMETSFEGRIDLHGFLGLNDDVRPGYQDIKVKVRIRADGASAEQKRELETFGPRFSPVFDTLSKGTRIEVECSCM